MTLGKTTKKSQTKKILCTNYNFFKKSLLFSVKKILPIHYWIKKNFDKNLTLKKRLDKVKNSKVKQAK